MTRFVFSLLLLSGLVAVQARAQDAEPVVARMQMKLALDGEIIDTIEKGDLLTVLEVREKSYVIQTFNGHKGSVANVTVSKLAEASTIYDELIAERPDEGRLFTLRASCHWALGDTEKALADYDQAIALGYREPHAYASRGLFHSAVGNHELAIKDFSEAIAGDHEDDVPLLNRAGVYMSTGKYEQAIADYTRAAELRTDNPVVYTQRAIGYKLLGKLEQALADYDRAIDLADRDVSAWMGRGYIKFQLGRHQAAVDDFTQVIELSPESAVAYNNRGYNYQQLGNEKLALQDYLRAVELAPMYLLALQNKAWMLTIAEDPTLRDPVAAIQTATTVCEISQYRDFSDLTLLAAAHASAEEFETAIGWQEKSLEFASEEQQTIARRLVDRYQRGLPLDPLLLEVSAGERPPSPLTTKPKI